MKIEVGDWIEDIYRGETESLFEILRIESEATSSYLVRNLSFPYMGDYVDHLFSVGDYSFRKVNYMKSPLYKALTKETRCLSEK